METISRHYNEKYFRWQRKRGEFAGWASLKKFEKYITPDSEVLDFGCGGGFLLKNLNCKKKVGVEVNPAAQKAARENQIEVYAKTEDIPEDYVDIIISDHCLEHVLHPLYELQMLYKVLRRRGKIIFCVPCESVKYAYVPDNISQHLYSWSPMCLGNLFTEAGFKVIESKPYWLKNPPFSRMIAKIGGRALFDILAWLNARITQEDIEVIIAGCK